MRATSRSRTTEPSGFERTTMSPNSSSVCSRPCDADRVGHFLPGGAGLAPTWPDGIDGALLLDCAAQVRDRQPELREQVRLHPDPHRVVAGAEDARLRRRPARGRARR